MERELIEYLVKGKDYILKKLITCEIAAVLCLLFISILVSACSEPKDFILALPFISILSLPIFFSAWCINHYFFYRIEIYPDGIYIRTNPFNGKSYYYNEIKVAHIEIKDLMNKHRVVTDSIYFLRFVDSYGNLRRIYFDNTYCINEIRLIVDRISKK